MAKPQMIAFRALLAEETNKMMAEDPSLRENPDCVAQEITMDDVNNVMAYKIRWGKHKGLTYRDIAVSYPAYFKNTVLRYQRQHPTSFTGRVFAALYPEAEQKTSEKLIEEPELGKPLTLKRARAMRFHASSNKTYTI